MTDRKHGMKSAGLGLRILAAPTLLVTVWFGAATSVTAQGESGQYGGMVIGAITCDAPNSCWSESGAAFTVTTEDGQWIGGCTVTGSPSDTSHVAACAVDFPFRPTGTVVVTEDVDTITPGYAPEENPIFKDTAQIGMASHDVIFRNVPVARNVIIGQPSDGTIVASGPTGEVDIALITRDPETGDLLTGTCYVLVDYSNEGCDENGDGQVTFAAIPFGTYTVQQTQTPAGYPTIDDYDIDVLPTGYMEGPPFGVPLGFVVKQAPAQNAPDTRNVSVILIDMHTREKVVAEVCVELIGASNVGCDDDLPDGQVDFLDVPAGGPYELRFTNLPAGYEVATVGGPLAVRIDAEPGAPANQMIFVLLVGPR